jgi:hypothetical protein
MMPTVNSWRTVPRLWGVHKGQSAVLFGDIGVLSLTGTKYTSGGGGYFDSY